MPKYPASTDDLDARAKLGARLVEIRTAAGLSQVEVAQACGKQQMWASRIETGATGVEPHEVAAWCRACGAAYALAIGEAATITREANYISGRPNSEQRLLARIARAMEVGGDYAVGRLESELERVEERIVFRPDEGADRAQG